MGINFEIKCSIPLKAVKLHIQKKLFLLTNLLLSALLANLLLCYSNPKFLFQLLWMPPCQYMGCIEGCDFLSLHLGYRKERELSSPASESSQKICGIFKLANIQNPCFGLDILWKRCLYVLEFKQNLFFKRYDWQIFLISNFQYLCCIR